MNRNKPARIENEDSDSTGNNSLASSTGLGNIGLGGMSSTEDGDNSLTSFEGLLNGIPNVESTISLNDDSNSKESLKSIPSSNSAILKNKPLMLADLLEKKVDKDVPILNGVINKELRLGEKGMDLVENHIEKALSKDPNKNDINDKESDSKQGIKRSASDDIAEVECKKPLLSSNINGNASADSPAPESVSSSNGDEPPATVSTAAAKLFADIAADILEDEDEEELMQQQTQIQEIAQNTAAVQQIIVDNNNQQQMLVTQSRQIIMAQPQTEETVQIAQNAAAMQQIIVDNNNQQQQVLMTQPRQIIVSQSQAPMMLPAGTQIKTQAGQTVIVPHSRQSVVLQQAGANAGQILFSQAGAQTGATGQILQAGAAGQFLLSQGGQVQLLSTGGAPGGQLVLSGGGASHGAYMVAQPQTAVVHGQPQTVLVAQTAQQQGTGAKTIIILQVRVIYDVKCNF